MIPDSEGQLKLGRKRGRVGKKKRQKLANSHFILDLETCARHHLIILAFTDLPKDEKLFLEFYTAKIKRLIGARVL